jgi:hypothetical protein
MNRGRIISYQTAKEQYLLDQLKKMITSKYATTIKLVSKEKTWLHLSNQASWSELLLLIEKEKAKETTTETQQVYELEQSLKDDLQENHINDIDVPIWADTATKNLFANISKKGLQELTKILVSTKEHSQPNHIVQNVLDQTNLNLEEKTQKHTQNTSLMRELMLVTTAIHHRKDWNHHSSKTKIIKETQRALGNGDGDAAIILLSQNPRTPTPF